jgi:3-deoxy-manno-octulosonate cytidylyltransferase (CMP-KDO synthetase)
MTRVARIVGVIPARFASARLPGKPLADILGRPMIEWVWTRASRAKLLSKVVIATDAARIAEAAQGFGATAVMTSPDCASGTDRVAEVAKRMRADYFVNIQGDEPLIDPDAVDALIAAAVPRRVAMATLGCDMREGEEASPVVVKIVVDRRGYALYFSRAPIPYQRLPGHASFIKHVGVYLYRRDVLLRLAALPPAPAELAESLEQLRALYYGVRIKVVHTPCDSPHVDDADELAAVVAECRRRGITNP